MKRFLFAVPALAFALNACGGGHATQSVLPPSSGTAATATRGALSVKLTLPKSTGVATASLSRRSPAYISAATTSVSLIFTPNTGTPTTQTFAVTPGAGSCPTSGSTTTCTFGLSIPFGSPPAAVSGTLTISALDAANVALSSAGIAVTVNPSGTNTVSATLGGIVSSVALAILPPSQSASGSAQIPITVEAFDPDGSLIVGPYAADAWGTAMTVNVSSNDSAHEPLNVASVSDSSTPVYVQYDGTLAAGPGATITATAGSLPSAQARLNYVAGGNAPGTYYFVTLPASGNGNVIVMNATTVVRTLTMSGRPATSAITVAPNGTIYAQSGPNSVDVFAPGATNATPRQTIVDANFSASAPILALAGSRLSGAPQNGVIIGGGSGATGQADAAILDMYAPGASTPSGHTTSPFGPIESVASSSNGNVYTFAANQSGTDADIETSAGFPSSISAPIVNWNQHQFTQYPEPLSGYAYYWDQANISDCHIAVDDVTSQLVVGCYDQYTVFSSNQQGNAFFTIPPSPTQYPYSGFLAYAPQSPPSNNNLLSLNVSGKTLGLSYDGAGNLASFMNGGLVVVAESAVQSPSSNTFSSTLTITPASGTVLAGTFGP